MQFFQSMLKEYKMNNKKQIKLLKKLNKQLAKMNKKIEVDLINVTFKLYFGF